jgi:antitoxin HicB
MGARIDIGQEIERLMALPYRIEMIPDEDGWFISIPDLPGCISQGSTTEEALEMIRDAQRMWLQTALEDGIAIPEPDSADEREYSGKFNVRVSRSLHRDLVRAATLEGVSLNLYVATALARAVPPASTSKA